MSILVIGIVSIYAVFSVAYILRVPWMKTRDAFNSTVYNLNAAESIAAWESLKNTIDNNFWIIPIVVVLAVVIGVYMVFQEKEYLRGTQIREGEFS